MFIKFRKFQYLALVISICFLLIPQVVSAQLAAGAAGGFMSALGDIAKNVEEIAGPMMGKLILLIIFFAFGFVFLVVSLVLLEVFIANQINWLSQIEPVTQAGFNFTSGLANMLLVLIFIIIAFAFIFKIESFQAKKTLPRLIIVALLLNFSLLFVNMLIDISQVAYNTILDARGENFFLTVMDTFISIGGAFLLTIIGLMTFIAISWAVPLAGGIAQVIFATLFGVVFLPLALTLIFVGCFLFLLASMFGLLVFLFGARIFVLQILGILAPLAFLCLILPQTKKYWSEWFNHLVQWLVLGIFVLFFLVLGFTVLGFLKPESSIPIPFLDFWNFPKYIVFYFALFIYMAVILYLGKKYIPIIANFLIDQGKSIGLIIWARGLRPYGGYMGRLVEKAAIEQQAREKEAKEKAEAARVAGKPYTPPRGLKAGRVIERPVSWVHRYFLGTTPQEAEKRRMAEARAEAEKIQDSTLLLTKIKDAIRNRAYGRAAALASEGIDKGKDFKALIEKIPETEAKKLGLEANIRGATKEAERIGRTFIDVADQMGFKSYDQLNAEDKAEWDAKGYKTIKDKLIGEAKGDEVRDFSKNFWKSESAMQAIVKFWGGPQISKAADEFSREFIEDYMKVINGLNLDQLLRINPRQALYLSGNPAQDLGLRWREGLERGMVRERMTQMGDEIPPTRMPTESDIAPLQKAIREAGFPEALLPETPSVSTEERKRFRMPGREKPPITREEEIEREKRKRFRKKPPRTREEEGE